MPNSSSRRSSPAKRSKKGSNPPTSSPLSSTSPAKRRNKPSKGTTVAKLCPHLDLKSNNKLMEQLLRALQRPSSACVFCEQHNPVMYVCLDCGVDFVCGCWTDGVFHLAAGHLGPGTGHYLSAVVGAGPEGLLLYCSRCHMHVWNTALQFLVDNYRHLRKDRLIKQVQAMQSSGISREANCVLIRGLQNLGQTCFLNSVLQCILHDPHLVRYFLNFHHDQQSCALKPHCMACVLDKFYQEMYSGKTTPFPPTAFLKAMWQMCRGLAGYEQQDSHEFLVSLLHLLHTHLADRAFGCDCLVHGIFSGVLESSVTCGKCGSVNSVFDPFMDISLQLLQTSGQVSMLECMERFTQPEVLPSGAYTCASCNSSEASATKQLRLRKLPKTLIIHLKRFKHDGSSSGKLNVQVAFPLQFSAYPFVSNHLERNAFSQGYRSKYAYRLYAVIAHLGSSLESGHYTTYINCASSWYQVNDARVHLTSAEEVLSAPAYLLFYSRLADDNDNALNI